MGSSVSGDPVWAVLIPPQLARFRALTGVGDAHLEIDFTGWNKYVVLDATRAFLFPRRPSNVEWFHRELAAYRALEPTALTVVPHLIGEWFDESVYPFPFAAVTRMRGVQPPDASVLAAALGRAIAEWHSIEPPELPGARPPAHHDLPHMRWLRRALDPATTLAAVAEAAERLDRSDCVGRWTEMLGSAARHHHVLVHGDIHEDQLLAVDGELTGILDWETARVDHPFWDFDLGEWGTGLWRRHRRDFSHLWAVMWHAYASERGLDTDSTPVETAFRLRHALAIAEADSDPAVVGTIAEHLARI
jgi:aminoglycoside phosphotransferase (APT) family kinase protein